MPNNLTPYISSVFSSSKKFISYYRSTNAQYIAVTGASILFGLSGISFLQPYRNWFIISAVLFILLTILYHFYTGRPFGIDVSCVPTHLVNGERQPDKTAEHRGLVLLQDGSCALHGEIRLSQLISNFRFRFNTSDEINAELRSKPKREHSYTPSNNLLECDNVSEREFQWVLDIHSNGNLAGNDRYYTVELIDLASSRVLWKFDVIDVSG